MEHITAPLIDLNTELDYERAIEVLRLKAGRFYRQYQAAKIDPTVSEVDRNRLLGSYGEAIETTKTLRPDDAATIRAIITDVA